MQRSSRDAIRREIVRLERKLAHLRSVAKKMNADAMLNNLPCKKVYVALGYPTKKRARRYTIQQIINGFLADVRLKLSAQEKMRVAYDSFIRSVREYNEGIPVQKIIDGQSFHRAVIRLAKYASSHKVEIMLDPPKRLRKNNTRLYLSFRCTQ